MLIIFGGGGVLGGAIVDQAIRRHDSRVLITANSSLTAAQDLRHRNPETLMAISCDVTSRADVDNVFDMVRKNNITPTAIINNFAFTYSEINQLSPEDEFKNSRKVFDVNYFGLLNVMEAAVSYFEDQRQPHLRLVNVLSNSLRTLNASNSNYIASKSAVETLSRSFAKKYGDMFSINCVAPGLMRSKLTEARFAADHAKIASVTPLGRLATPEEIAVVILFLAIDCPVSVSGQTIYVDGGRTI